MVSSSVIIFSIIFLIFKFDYCICKCMHKSGKKYSKEFVDLSYSFSKDTIYFPGQREFSLNKDYDNVENVNGFRYSAFSFCMAEHGGTHLDAPFHFSKEGWTVDKIPATHLINVPAVVIDVSDEVDQSPIPSQFTLNVNHLIKYEQSVGKNIPFQGVVLIRTGWSKYWPNKTQYLGWNNSTNGNSTSLNFPGVSIDAAKWLANERGIVGIGIDTSSVDPGSNEAFPVHVFLAEKLVYNLENMANLHLIKHSCSLTLFVLPIKLVGGTGSPARVLAYEDCE